MGDTPKLARVGKTLTEVVQAFLASLMDTGHQPSAIRSALLECGFIGRAQIEDALRDGRNSAFEAAAQHCDDIADLLEQGAGEREPGHRLRQAARNIRMLKHGAASREQARREGE